MEPVDVVMLTKNSEHLLEKCLTSVFENVLVKRLIVVDGSSTDNTLKIMDKFNRKYGNVEILTENGSRATARERGIQAVETDWFMFADSDMILCKDWFKRTEKHIEDDVGAIWGLNIDVIPNVKSRFFLKSLVLGNVSISEAECMIQSFGGKLLKIFGFRRNCMPMRMRT